MSLQTNRGDQRFSIAFFGYPNMLHDVFGIFTLRLEVIYVTKKTKETKQAG